MPARPLRIAAFSLLALAGGASAQEAYNPSWYAVPSLTTMSADTDWNADNSRMGGGLAVGRALTQSLDLQLGAYGNHSKSSDNANFYRQNLFGGDLLWLFSRGKFRPFLLAGGGVEHDKINSGNAKNAGYINGGGGIQWFFNPSIFLQADARYVYGFTDSSYWGDKLGSSGNGLYRIGLGWVFSQPPAPAPVAQADAPKPVAAPAAAPAPAPKPSAEKVTLAADALFDFDKAVLRDDGKAKLTEFADQAKKLSTLEVITAVGYTDRLGKDAYNQTLSERRAAAVKNFLIEQGIDANRVATEGRGKANPIAPCTGLGAENNRNKLLVECLQTNRRVEIEVIGTRMP